MFSKRSRAYTYILLTMLIWGTALPIIKYTLSGIDPLPFITYRLSISAVISVLFFARKISRGKKFHQFRAHFPLAMLYGFLAVPVALLTLFFGLDSSTALDTALIGVIGPLIVTGGGALIFHEHITKREKTGILIVLLGVFLNSFFPLFKHQNIQFTGNLILLVYLLSDSASVLVAKRVSRLKVNPSNLTSLAFVVGFVTILPITIYQYGVSGYLNIIANLPFKYHLGVWYMAVLSGTIAYYLYIRAQKSIEVSEAALFSYLSPVISIPISIFWLKETLSSHYIIGAAIIAVGLYIAEKKTKAKPV